MGVPLILIFELIIISALSVCESAGPIIYRISTSLGFDWKKHGIQLQQPNEGSHNLSPMYISPAKAPTQHQAVKHPQEAFAPSVSSLRHPARNSMHGSASLSSLSFYKHRHAKNKTNLAPKESKYHPSSTYSHEGLGPSISLVHSPSPSATSQSYPIAAPSPATTPG